MTEIEDIHFPGMPEAPEPLWAVHVEGPDDVIAACDRAEADQKAKEINDLYEAFTKRPDHNPELDGRWHAKVIPWPYTAGHHAIEIADPDRWNG